MPPLKLGERLKGLACVDLVGRNFSQFAPRCADPAPVSVASRSSENFHTFAVKEKTYPIDFSIAFTKASRNLWEIQLLFL